MLQIIEIVYIDFCTIERKIINFGIVLPFIETKILSVYMCENSEVYALIELLPAWPWGGRPKTGLATSTVLSRNEPKKKI